MKYLIALAFVGILGSLGAALWFMMRDGQNGQAKTSRMAKALAWRVGLSIVVFLALLIAWQLGWIKPTGIPPGR